MNTLQHKGPCFIQYKVKDPSIHFLNSSSKVSLNCYLASIRYSNISDEIKRDKIFQKNFSESYKKLLPSHMKNIKLSDIHFNKLKNINVKSFHDVKHKFCKINNIEYELSNYLIEPLSIFIGRGDHPLRGIIKIPPRPEQITINLGTHSKIPKCNFNIIRNPDVQWAAFYKNSMGHSKYMYPLLNNESTKFQNARNLKKQLPKLRQKILKDLFSNDFRLSQKGLVVYLIDKLCIRVGHPKEELVDTVGCCTLRCEHFKLLDNNKVSLNFVGKDSIPYSKTFSLIPSIFSILQNLISNKSKYEQVFNLVDANSINTYLNSLFPGITAKEFRTCHSSDKMCKDLGLFNHLTDENPIKYFNLCNKKIAILCNHKKGENYNLETSKSNYIDPRIIFSYSKFHNIDINKLLSKSLQEKHKWALNSKNFKF